jgi:hypothetical protein
MRQNLTFDYLFIEIDWKQKISIGMSPRQISREFYNQQYRTILGFGLYYRNMSNKIECLNIDLVSDVIDQSCHTVISAFR